MEDRSQLSSLPGEPAAWRALARSADDHGVVPTVVRNLRRLGWPGVPDDVRSHLETSERLNAARNAIIARGLRGVLERFARAGIPVVPLKGVTLAESLYGDVTLRVCSDVDILVPRAAVGASIELLRLDGYEGADRYQVNSTDIDSLLRSSMEYCLLSPPAALRYPLELHWDIAWRWRGDSEMIEALWAEARPGTALGVEAWMLSSEWQLLYLAVHAAHHRWGVLKWLVDIDEVCQRADFKWLEVMARARRFGLERALHLSLAACHTLLGTTVSPELERYPPPRRLRRVGTAPVRIGGWDEALSAVRLFRRPDDKIRYLGRLLLQPALAEWRLVRLPPGLRFLYYLLRPLRLGVASGRTLLRVGLGRLHP